MEGKVMDAVSFIREWTRMCKKYESCGGCPLFRETGSPCDLPYTFSEVTVDVVQKWSKENPVMKNWMKFEEVFGCKMSWALDSPTWWAEEYKEQ